MFERIGFDELWNQALAENSSVLIVIGLVFAILVFATLLFWTIGKINPEADLTELKQRTKSWWAMSVIFVSATLINQNISYIAFALLSYVSLREITSISRAVRDSDRTVLFWAYLAIPVQYYLASIGEVVLFLIFIPIFMNVWIPFMMVLKGDTDNISSAMSALNIHQLLTVYSISHLALLITLPELQDSNATGRSMLLFVVFITEMNDVFQYTWGKLFGRFKIIPKISPHKTWEGFIGGVLSSIVAGYFLRFLTPFNATEALLISGALASVGFVGDLVVSAVKRDMGLKDMSDTIPGHGGILDRIDSLAMTSPVFFHIVYFLYYT